MSVSADWLGARYMREEVDYVVDSRLRRDARLACPCSAKSAKPSSTRRCASRPGRASAWASKPYCRRCSAYPPDRPFAIGRRRNDARHATAHGRPRVALAGHLNQPAANPDRTARRAQKTAGRGAPERTQLRLPRPPFRRGAAGRTRSLGAARHACFQYPLSAACRGDRGHPDPGPASGRRRRAAGAAGNRVCHVEEAQQTQVRPAAPCRRRSS